MATFLPGNTNYQNENLSSSYLGDQKPLSYLGSASNSSSSSMMYLNQGSTVEFSEVLPGNSLSLLNCVQLSSVGGRSEMSFIPPTSDAMNLHQMRNQLDGNQNFQSQGLSLSLGSQIQSSVTLPSYQYQFQGYNSSLLSNYPPFSGKGGGCDESKTGMELRNSNLYDAAPFSNSQCSISQKGIHSSVYQYEPAGFSSVISNSKYLKATQELLDEVVSVRKALKQADSNKDQSFQSKSASGIPSETSESELSPAEKQELQTKKTKLLSMLDEVDRRYKQYYHQMKIIVSSFDMVAGNGAAKPYTALALQTISRHFRCLRDAISAQIQMIQRNLGEQETSSNQGEVIPRLRLLDHQLRQQRALQHLGVMRNAWRPQRGLPESSVSILRAWLFEHFLHPYPKDSEKTLLAKQTGLTRNQVANWFINARVRLWKPMIEEMYKEEFGELEANSKLENSAKAHRENSSASEDVREDLQESSMASKPLDTDSIQSGTFQQFNSDNVPDEELNRPTERSMYQNIGHVAHHRFNSNNNNNIYVPGSFIPSNQGDTLYDLPELNDFGVSSSNQVSLALGLRRQETNAYNMSDEANTRDDNRFGNPHVLHDFVV